MSMSCASVADGQGRFGAEVAHRTQRDDTAGSGVTKGTIASAIVGFVISLIVESSSSSGSFRGSPRAMVLRRVLGGTRKPRCPANEPCG